MRNSERSGSKSGLLSPQHKFRKGIPRRLRPLETRGPTVMIAAYRTGTRAARVTAKYRPIDVVRYIRVAKRKVSYEVHESNFGAGMSHVWRAGGTAGQGNGAHVER